MCQCHKWKPGMHFFIWSTSTKNTHNDIKQMHTNTHPTNTHTHTEDTKVQRPQTPQKKNVQETVFVVADVMRWTWGWRGSGWQRCSGWQRGFGWQQCSGWWLGFGSWQGSGWPRGSAQWWGSGCSWTWQINWGGPGAAGWAAPAATSWAGPRGSSAAPCCWHWQWWLVCCKGPAGTRHMAWPASAAPRSVSAQGPAGWSGEWGAPRRGWRCWWALRRWPVCCLRWWERWWPCQSGGEWGCCSGVTAPPAGAGKG